ncbi:MAG: hypothetical protein Q7R52_01605 [archaeon]|nr:hypothetical protein [archaeon]
MRNRKITIIIGILLFLVTILMFFIQLVDNNISSYYQEIIILQNEQSQLNFDISSLQSLLIKNDLDYLLGKIPVCDYKGIDETHKTVNELCIQYNNKDIPREEYFYGAGQILLGKTRVLMADAEIQESNISKKINEKPNLQTVKLFIFFLILLLIICIFYLNYKLYKQTDGFVAEAKNGEIKLRKR